MTNTTKTLRSTFEGADAAAYVDRTVTDIFDDSATTAGGQN